MTAAAAVLLLSRLWAPGASAQTVSSAAAPAPAITIAWPSPGAKYPPVSRSFTFGAASPGSSVSVNGLPVAVSSDGAFIATVDFSTGAFALRFTAERDGVAASTEIVVSVEAPVQTSPADADLDMAFLEPRADLEVSPGDVVTVQAKGPPGLQGTFRIKRLAKNLPLAEQPGPVGGFYVGQYRLQPDDRGRDLAVSFKLRDPATRRRLKAQAPGRVTVRDARLWRVAVTSAPLTVIKTEAGGYELFVPAGVRVVDAGRAGRQTKVRLGPDWSGWIDSDKLLALPEGTPAPSALIGRDASVETSTASSKLLLPVSERVPFSVRELQDPFGLALTFFTASQRLDRLYLKTDDPVIESVTWRQAPGQRLELQVRTRLRRGWGYDAGYDERGRFALEIRRAPAVDPKQPLRGRVVALDPGHAPDRGAIGPRGTQEQDVSLAIALKARELLEREGASVFMVRDSTRGVALADRPGLAWQARAEAYVSVHANALAVGDDPLARPRGYMNFFYQPQGRALAEALDRAYARRFPSLTREGVFWGDLSVCRGTQMPSALTETAYLILPDQEALLRSAEGQLRFAQAIADGLRDFFKP